jgi:AcrR family transcriptional regulator
VNGVKIIFTAFNFAGREPSKGGDMKPQGATSEPKPYHHGDLRRALLRAAETILERDGLAALSLRAVAREAGVSPAAPYHHFKDKNELLLAVGSEGFAELRKTMVEAFKKAGDEPVRIALGVAYVEFAQAHPALYRVMWDSARNGDNLPDAEAEQDSAFTLVRRALREATGDKLSELDLELTSIAAWCAAHGLAEMNNFAQFDPLKKALGGERNFLRAVLQHMGAVAGKG